MTEQELLEKGYRKYSGEEIDVFYNKDVCQHVANCVKGNADVFKVKRRPWIIADNADADEVARVVSTCPTKALQFIRKNGGN